MSIFTGKNLGLVGLAMTAALLASGCGSTSENATPDNATTANVAQTPAVEQPALTPEHDQAVLDSMQVTGEPGSEPDFTCEPPVLVSTNISRLISDGTGAPLSEGQMLTVHGIQKRGDTCEVVFSTWATGLTESFPLGGLDAEWLEVFNGAHVGARGLVINPMMIAGEQSSMITLLEVIGATDVLTRATGTPQTVDSDATGVLVTLADDGEPSIEIADGFVPSDELVVQTLIEGSGPIVTADQEIIIHYTGWLLDGTVFDSSWAHGSPASFPLAGLIPGWTQGLAGQHVGSQVLLIIPPDLAYGPDGQGPVPGNATLIFVVDILYAS